MEQLEIIRSFLKDIQEKKFRSFKKNKKTGATSFNDLNKLKNDKRYKEVNKWIKLKYEIEEYGIKSLIKDFNLPITYPVLRNCIINYFDTQLRKPNIRIERLCRIRKEKCEREKKLGIGWFNEDIQKKNKILNSIKRGIQGYYFNNTKNKFVWLRSSYEFILAEWLNINN